MGSGKRRFSGRLYELRVSLRDEVMPSLLLLVYGQIFVSKDAPISSYHSALTKVELALWEKMSTC